MSKYTTEVRFICEQKAGLSESAGWTSVDEIINRSYDKIFDVDSIPFFNAEHRSLLLKKILLHYYTREIGYETVGLWMMKLNQKMREIMPYYNQLYESELLDYDPLKNVDNTLDHNGSYNSDKTEHSTDRDAGYTKDTGDTDVMLRHTESRHDAERNTKVTREDSSHTGNTWTTFSDTPQGALNGVRDENYLTNATHVEDDPSFVDTNTKVVMANNDYDTLEYNKGKKNDADYKDNTHIDIKHDVDVTKTYNKDIDNDKGWDVHKDHQTGKIGTETYQEMVIKYRETFLNIDMMIIKELSDLFMKVW